MHFETNITVRGFDDVRLSFDTVLPAREHIVAAARRIVGLGYADLCGRRHDIGAGGIYRFPEPVELAQLHRTSLPQQVIAVRGSAGAPDALIVTYDGGRAMLCTPDQFASSLYEYAHANTPPQFGSTFNLHASLPVSATLYTDMACPGVAGLSVELRPGRYIEAGRLRVPTQIADVRIDREADFPTPRALRERLAVHGDPAGLEELTIQTALVRAECFALAR